MKQSNKKCLHGVFMDVFGLGVILMGKSGIGKSEVALNLINRGHRLIADDSIEFIRTNETTLQGQCTPLLQDFLEVRGLGVLNIRQMFGDIAVKPRKILDLIVNLLSISDEQFKTTDRLLGMHRKRQILNIKIPEVTIPVSPGRNLAILVEGAVRNQLLRLKGYIASEDFKSRHKNEMK